MLDKDKVYDEVLKDENNASFKLINRLTKTIANFARNGYIVALILGYE